MKDSSQAGIGPSGAPAEAPSEMQQVQAIQDAEINRQRTLMDMLIEDAREGRVKDPEGRNAKGRHEVKFKPSKVGRRTPDKKASPIEAADDATASTTTAPSAPSIANADRSLNRLRDALGGGADGEKLVERHKLV